MFLVKQVLPIEVVNKILTALKRVPMKPGATYAKEGHKRNEEVVLPFYGNQIKHYILNNPIIIEKLLPYKCTVPRFNKYEKGQFYRKHVDFAFQETLRTDFSFTAFLNNSSEYTGGELVIEDIIPSPIPIKAEAGDIIFYPSGKQHQVMEVTEGVRWAAIGWIQSTIRNASQREIISKLSRILKTLDNSDMKSNFLIDLSEIYTNLIRQWSD